MKAELYLYICIFMYIESLVNSYHTSVFLDTLGMTPGRETSCYFYNISKPYDFILHNPLLVIEKNMKTPGSFLQQGMENIPCQSGLCPSLLHGGVMMDTQEAEILGINDLPTCLSLGAGGCLGSHLYGQE